MIRENVIPLTKEWILHKDIYFILQIFNTNLIWIDYDTAREPFLLFNLSKPLRRGEINRTTWYEKQELINTIAAPHQEDFICLMPRETLDLLFNSSKTLSTKERATVVRVFIYLYYYSMWTTNGWYSHSREHIAAELHINQARFSNSVKWLEERGFLARGNYLIGMEARRYYIPEFLWTEECKRFNEVQKK